MEKKEKKLIEAALFISGRALSMNEFRSLTGIGAVGYLKKVIDELKNDYNSRGSAIEIVNIEDKYLMQVKDEYLSRVKSFAQDQEISKSALRVLAYISKISKNGFCIKSDVAKKLGSYVYPLVKELVESGFVKEKRFGRTSKLILTEKFRKYFGDPSNKGQMRLS